MSSFLISAFCSSVSSIHVLVALSTSISPLSRVGGLNIWQSLMMWSAVCSGAPHSQLALSARPHARIDDLNLPTPVRQRFSIVHSIVHCQRGSSSPVTCFRGESKKRWSIDGSATCHCIFQLFLSQESLETSGGTDCRSRSTAWAKGRRDFNRLRIGGIVTTSCRRWEMFFIAVRESASLAASLRRLTGAILAMVVSWMTGWQGGSL